MRSAGHDAGDFDGSGRRFTGRGALRRSGSAIVQECSHRLQKYSIRDRLPVTACSTRTNPTTWQWTQGLWVATVKERDPTPKRSEEHTSELQSRLHLVCRLLLEKKKKKTTR